MSARAAGVTTGVAIVLALVLSMVVGTLIGPLIAVSLVTGAAIGGRTARRVTPATASRALARGSVGVLVILGVVFRTLLVANQSDNAYVWIAVLGTVLLFPAVPFALAAIVPRAGATSWLIRIGVVLLWLIAAPGLVLLAIGGGLSVMATLNRPGFCRDSGFCVSRTEKLARSCCTESPPPIARLAGPGASRMDEDRSCRVARWHLHS